MLRLKVMSDPNWSGVTIIRHRSLKAVYFRKCLEFSGKTFLFLAEAEALVLIFALQVASLGGNIFINYGHHKAFADNIVDEDKSKRGVQ